MGTFYWFSGYRQQKVKQDGGLELRPEASLIVPDFHNLCTAVHAILYFLGLVLSSSFLSPSISWLSILLLGCQ